MNDSLQGRIDNLIYSKGNKLLPSTLYSYNNGYDGVHIENIEIEVFEKRYKEFLELLKFENFTTLQLSYLFEQLDNKHDKFKSKEWYEFNTLTKKYFTQKPKTEKLPEEVRECVTEDKLNEVKKKINTLRNKITSLYKNLRQKTLPQEQIDKLNNDLKTEIIVKDIIGYIKKSEANFTEYHDRKYADEMNGAPVNLELEEEFEKISKDCIFYVTKYICRLREISAEVDYYFFDCTLNVYKNTYEQRKNEFFKENIDADEPNFIKAELFKRYNPVQHRIVEDWLLDENYHHLFEKNLDTEISNEKIIELLELKLSQYNLNYNTQLDETGLINIILEEKETQVEKKNSVRKNQLTANQIVILLDKLGLFADPYFETLPNTTKAKILNLITGLNDKNLKTYIEKLDKSPKDLSKNYLKDLDKIDSLLNSLK